MESARVGSQQKILMVALPLLADGLAAVVLIFWFPAQSLRLITPSGWNALLAVFFYILFCTGVYFSRKLVPQPAAGNWPPPSWLMDPRLRGVLGLLFALLMATTFAYQLGYFETVMQIRAGLLDEGAASAFFVYAPGAWLGFSMLVILVLAFPVNASVSPADTRYLIVAALSLLFTNSMLVFIAAQTGAIIAGMNLSRGVVTALIAAAAFILSFLPARAIYQSRQPHLSGWVSFTLLLLLSCYLAVFA